ncbi:MAG: chemotaxis protein CheV, partial [Candidatus Nealsonbacteria bacterium]|nr:chemotaxis protein CheV [Candidatus Nealsonbacteria bacterium]
MASVNNILLDKEILLESGTNELEVLVFDVADYTFGINVAKVREVLPTPAITGLPRAHPSVRGVFKLRDHVIPCVSLSDYLGAKSTGENAESIVILTEVNQRQTAFLVDQVERIHRLSWENVLSVPGLKSLAQCPVTALARCEDRLVEMLDFEKVLEDVTEDLYNTDAIANPFGLPRADLKILLAEDSPTIRELIRTSLTNSGYTQLQFFENGAEAWAWIEARLAETGKAEEVADLIISDVEMPQVDGFHLTKRIKGHPELQRIPVLLYSSIITADNHKKGQAVGADLQIAKPDLYQVVELADKLIAETQGLSTGATTPAESPAPAAKSPAPAAKSPAPAAKSPAPAAKSPA